MPTVSIPSYLQSKLENKKEVSFKEGYIYEILENLIEMNIELKEIDNSRLCPQENFAEIIASIKASRFVVSGDTGSFHLSELLGVPGILLTGATGPETGIFSHHAFSLIKTRDLPCSPCSFNGRDACFYFSEEQVPCMSFSKHDLNSTINQFDKSLAE